ncbi:carboxypeptidase-like regulatory domain-containing protein [Psychroflexus montanilacus]|uniref:carboxypeptidase-like regulatory domain-containing protein n=1 Tax=Psychroflexus montanilacus TaxID=2873598 RepID=UPI001CCA4F8A|nr:carboxypeptidase-like regulatory domain-containing protein [Psychroflexus montanilacus]MBZ9650655.1 carboxypeptidase-like regulatory domain-containing protein [Psychroflexus montanilacus]
MSFKHISAFLLVFLTSMLSWGQDSGLETISGVVINASNDKPLENVNIVNINTVKGSTTNKDGEFQVKANINDTLYLSYLGFRSIQVKITEDWVKFGDVKVKMTESAIALEEVKLQEIQLTGYLEIDAKNIPIYDNYRYSISGLDYAYEGGNYQRSAISKVLQSISNPADLLYKTFSKKDQQMRRLRKMKMNESIKEILQDKYDRETLSAVLQISKDDIDEVLDRCNYSRDFVTTANDLQVLDAISSCYEEYRAINR